MWFFRAEPAPAYPARDFSRVTLRQKYRQVRRNWKEGCLQIICDNFLSNPRDASRKKHSCRVGKGAICTRNRIKSRTCKRAFTWPWRWPLSSGSDVPSSLSVNRPIWGKSANFSMQMTPLVCSRAIAICSCLMNRGRSFCGLPDFLSTSAINFCQRESSRISASSSCGSESADQHWGRKSLPPPPPPPVPDH